MTAAKPNTFHLGEVRSRQNQPRVSEQVELDVFHGTALALHVWRPGFNPQPCWEKKNNNQVEKGRSPWEPGPERPKGLPVLWSALLLDLTQVPSRLFVCRLHLTELPLQENNIPNRGYDKWKDGLILEEDPSVKTYQWTTWRESHRVISADPEMTFLNGQYLSGMNPTPKTQISHRREFLKLIKGVDANRRLIYHCM
jgi:hypothetical protein